jgi:hypothetical protein
MVKIYIAKNLRAKNLVESNQLWRMECSKKWFFLFQEVKDAAVFGR